jgi:hypothetical protein
MADKVNEEMSYEEEFSWAERMAIWYEQADDPEGEPLIEVFRREHADSRLLAPLKERLRTVVDQELPPLLEKASDDLIGICVDGGWFQMEVTFKCRIEKEAMITQALNRIT